MKNTWNRKIENIIAKFAAYKYYIMTGATGLSHAAFCVIFFRYKVYPMAIFNIFSPILYFMTWFLLNRKVEYAVFIFEYLEILIHGILATWFVGWDTGFGQYLIALVPLGFMACYELTSGRRRFTIASILGLCATITYVLCGRFDYISRPVYELPGNVNATLYTFNSIISFSFLFFFMIIYTFVINEMETQLKRQNAVLDRMASTDPLTSLLNRRSMGEFLQEAAGGNADFCVAMCDIDDFKQVNDSYGHEAGDLVLKEVTRIIKETVPAGNPICRWGGEEILILFNGFHKGDAVKVCEQVRQGVAANHIPFYNKTLHVTITIGVAPHLAPHAVEETISEADNKLYYGKKHGKDQVVSVLRRV